MYVEIGVEGIELASGPITVQTADHSTKRSGHSTSASTPVHILVSCAVPRPKHVSHTLAGCRFDPSCLPQAPTLGRVGWCVARVGFGSWLGWCVVSVVGQGRAGSTGRVGKGW